MSDDEVEKKRKENSDKSTKKYRDNPLNKKKRQVTKKVYEKRKRDNPGKSI